MVLLKIDDLEVDFPYDPYPCQIKYMESVVRCLKLGWNGILESPTGTGKTLCLLCAALAWQQRRKVQSSEIFVQGGDVGDIFSIPKIIYTSRTHSQLSQVVRELNKTVYKSVNICILGSRDQMCINETVQAEKNSIIKNHMCRSHVKARKCHYYNEFEKHKSMVKGHFSDGKALDIEDLVTLGRKAKVCPYYKSRETMDSADLYLMPYNYILDPKQSICEESVSVSFSTKDLGASIKEAQNTLKLIIQDQQEIRSIMDQSNAAFGSQEARQEKEETAQLEIEPNDLANLTERLQKFEEVLYDLKLGDLDKNPEEVKIKTKLPGKAFPENFIRYLLGKADIDYMHREAIVALADKVANYLSIRSINKPNFKKLTRRY